MKKNQIDLYYASVCGLCAKAIDFLRSRGLDFSAHAVIWDQASDAFVKDENAIEMFRRCAQTVDFVPQIFVNGTHIAGWRRLEPMIKSGEFDRLLD